MSIKFQLIDSYSLIVPDNISWVSYHLTKHLIINYSKEGFDNIFDFSKKEIKEIRKTQLEDYSCTVGRSFHNKHKLCKECDSLIDCNNELSSFKKVFFEKIINSIMADYSNPIHATFTELNDDKNMLLIIDKHGISIILKRNKGDGYRLQTAYGRDYIATNEMGLKFLKLDADIELRKNKSIREWKKKLNNNQKYRSVIMYKMENWEFNNEAI